MTKAKPTLAQQVVLAPLLLLPQAGAASAGVDTAWVRWYDGPYHGIDYGSALALDNQGDIIVACMITSSARNFDIAVLKYSPAGELLWASRYAGPAGCGDWPMALTVDEADNIYVAGAGESLANEADMLTLKYNPDGELQWAAWHAGPSSFWGDEATAVAADDFGNVYVTGWEAFQGPERRYVTIKYDSLGNEQWMATYQGQGFENLAWAIAVNPAGRVFVTGISHDSLTNGFDMATVCYDAQGNEKWVARVPAGGGGGRNAIALDGAGGVYVGGSGGGNASPLTIVRYDSTGGQRWIARYVGPDGLGGQLHGLAVDGRGHVYGTGIVSLQYPDADFATLKYDSTGSEHWARLWGGAAGGVDRALAIALDSTGGVYVTGSSHTGPGLDMDECVTVKYSSRGEEKWDAHYTSGFSTGGSGSAVGVDEHGHVYVTGNMAMDSLRLVDAFVIKYIETPGGVVGPGAIQGRVRLQPTLVRGMLTLDFSAGRADLLDLSGRVVMTLSSGPNDVRHLAPGIYFVRRESAAVTKVVVAR